MVLVTQHEAYRFAFNPASPTETADLIFASDDLTSICNQASDDGGKTYYSDCDHTQKADVALQKTLPDASGSTITFGVIEDGLLVTT